MGERSSLLSQNSRLDNPREGHGWERQPPARTASFFPSFNFFPMRFASPIAFCRYEQGEYERGPHSRAEARESKSVWLYFGLYA